MKVIARTKAHNFFAAFLLVMFIGHYANIRMFYHSHVLNGVTYSHSHFYGLGKSTTPVSLPQHSEEQLKLIQDYNNITWNSDLIIPEITNPVFRLLSVFISPTITDISVSKVLHYSLRAPPAFILV